MSGPGKYRKKPVVIEALKFTGSNAHEVATWLDHYEEGDLPFGGRCDFYEIETLEGTMIAEQGDYIVKGVEGEAYPVKPSVFHKTYGELVTKTSDPADTINEIKERVDGATPGPWITWQEFPFSKPSVCTDDGQDVIGECPDDHNAARYEKPDAEFISNAPTDVDRLTRTLGAVLGVIEKQEQMGYLISPDSLRRHIRAELAKEDR